MGAIADATVEQLGFVKGTVITVSQPHLFLSAEKHPFNLCQEHVVTVRQPR